MYLRPLNVHGDARGLKFYNIVGYDCFDEGFSAHDTCECEIIGGRFYGNENGIADVNDHALETRFTTRWGQDYDGEQMMEHAACHPGRHVRQLRRFLDGELGDPLPTSRS